MTETTTAVPSPGSQAAIDRGCTCPVLDNAHGRGFPHFGETSFYMTEGCPLHWPKSDGEGT